MTFVLNLYIKHLNLFGTWCLVFGIYPVVIYNTLYVNQAIDFC